VFVLHDEGNKQTWLAPPSATHSMATQACPIAVSVACFNAKKLREFVLRSEIAISIVFHWATSAAWDFAHSERGSSADCNVGVDKTRGWKKCIAGRCMAEQWQNSIRKNFQSEIERFHCHWSSCRSFLLAYVSRDKTEKFGVGFSDLGLSQGCCHMFFLNDGVLTFLFIFFSWIILVKLGETGKGFDWWLWTELLVRTFVQLAVRN